MGKRQLVDELREEELAPPQLLRRRSAQDDYLDKHGREKPDPVPLAPPLGYKKQESLSEQIRRMVLSERLKQEAEMAGAETFEEADDFEVGDDFDPTSPYEEVFEPMPDMRAAFRQDLTAALTAAQKPAEAVVPTQPPAPPEGGDMQK